jgi:hypothetical protein
MIKDKTKAKNELLLLDKTVKVHYSVFNSRVLESGVSGTQNIVTSYYILLFGARILKMF